MAFVFTSSYPSLSISTNNITKPLPLPRNPQFIASSVYPSLPCTPLKYPSLRSRFSVASTSNPDAIPETDPEDSIKPNQSSPDASSAASTVTDEWGEKSQPETEPVTKLADSDPPKDEDEWEERNVSTGKEEEEEKEKEYVSAGNGSSGYDKVGELKRCLVDTFYGTDLGFRASSDVRAEIMELVNQLEAVNPTPAPVEDPALLDGNWILLYTAFSELLPLLAAGSTPLFKVDSICQSIDSNSLSIVNSTTLSTVFASFSFSASAAFEVQSPSRILVEFKEGVLQPPEIKSTLNLPENLDVFGQKISLSPVQQSLSPLQEVAANISRIVTGQRPLKIPIPGNRTKSWLLTTYLDKDLRISRGDGGIFVLAKEGSPLLEQ